MSPGDNVHRERTSTSKGLAAALTAAVAVCAAVAGQAVAQGRLTPGAASVALAGVALLAMLGLRSLSPRAVALVIVGVSAVLLIRFGVGGGSFAGEGQLILVWMVSAVVAVVLSHRVGVDALDAFAEPGPEPAAPSSAVSATTSGASAARTVAVVAAAVVLLALLLAPVVLPFTQERTSAGQGASLDALGGGSAALRASDDLDMTRRPDLTDEVVLRIDSDAVTFWRGETFDEWDGRRWSRSDDSGLPLPAAGVVEPAPEDLGARGPDVVRQRVEVRAEFAEVVYGAPSMVGLDIDQPARQRPDGTVVASPMGKGTVYTVESRREPLSPERLRAVDGPIPREVAERYAASPTATDRVIEAAQEVVADAPTQYDAVLALQEWMGGRAEYSLDAPLAPEGVDVVDHFLFEAEQGWCEQIASSLVVMARANGIPARLVTGYVPDERDPVTGTFTVRQRNAHAWAEVWFPEVGWVPFDPTADVPLAGDDQRDPTIAEWLVDHLVLIVLALAVLALVAGPLRSLVRRRLARRAPRSVAWAAATDRRLARLGEAIDRPRRPDETAEAFARALVRRYGDGRLVDVGRALDEALYDEVPLSAERRSRAERILSDVEASPRPESRREPQPV